MGSKEIQCTQHVINLFNDENVKKTKSIKDLVSTNAMAVLLMSLVAVILDPYFLYIPVVKNASTCLDSDNNLRIVLVVFRSCADILHTILWWHHSWPSVEGRYRRILAWIVAILAILPLPQVVIFVVSWQLLTVNILKYIVLIQFVLRLCRIFPAYYDATGVFSDELLMYKVFAAAYNLVLYSLASNVLGAIWYLHAIERNLVCWRGACHKNPTLCGGSSLYCDDSSSYNQYLHKHCSILQASSTKSFDYGIYDEAFQTKIIEMDTPFLNKIFQCFWWGLRNLSSLGQNLKTGDYIWDSFFAITTAILGLVLFALLIGNMQNCLQALLSEKHTNLHTNLYTNLHLKFLDELERAVQKKRRLKRWGIFKLLPGDLREKVEDCQDPKWQETSEVNLKSLLNNIPVALKEELKLHLCGDMFIEIPYFNNLSKGQRDALCFLAKPMVYPERSYILREGDPIREVLFVLHGTLLSYSKCSTQIVPAEQLSAHCFIGEELLQQLKQAQQLQPSIKPSLKLPIASKTIEATTKVEAFALSSMHLNNVFARFTDDLAAAAIQNAWRKIVKAKLEGRLRQEETDSSIKECKNCSCCASRM